MVTVATLCHVLDGNKLLLKKATRGISKDKWNAPGGKINGEKTAEKNIVREVFEETGLKIKNAFYHGELKFFLNGKDELSFIVHLFSTKDFSGEIKQTEEGEVKWFGVNEIPYDEMWADDKLWLPLMLDGKKFDCSFFLDSDNKQIIKHEIRLK